MSPNINKMAGATQHMMPAIEALRAYLIPHFIRLGFFSWAMELDFHKFTQFDQINSS